MKKKIIAILCAAALAVPTLCVNAEYKESDLKDAVNDAIEWKDEHDSPFYSIGSNSSNLYIIALKRMGKNYDYTSYLSGLDGIAAGYGSEHNASDMQRTALAAMCAGGDAQNVGGRDLVADSTYFRDAAAPIDKDGADGYSWALITLDSNSYQTPDWAIKDRNSIIAGMLSHQNTDGSFDGSAYSTAVAITALAPYYETSGAYTITQNQTGWTLDLSPREAVENALSYLSETQGKEGDWGDLRSTAMTVIALDTMGIDCNGDDRFTARKGTAFDGLMSYQGKDGGFALDGNKSDGEATSYALCALTSHLRKVQGKSTLFNFSVNDSVTFETPATPKPTSNTTSGSSSSAKTTPKPAATAKATAKPTTKPSSTKNPEKTMQPTRTTTPQSEVTPRPSSTPRATKRPALVGPVEMPGPMQPTDPPEINSGGSQTKETSHGAVPAIVVGIIAVIALCAFVILWYMNKMGKNTKNKSKEIYRAKRHRKTEQHRRFDERERYRRRKKYDRRKRT
ncbi:MAG: prenyltransferase/squalene oxidase repeat-containing protein [Hominilimicola sp.]